MARVEECEGLNTFRTPLANSTGSPRHAIARRALRNPSLPPSRPHSTSTTVRTVVASTFGHGVHGRVVRRPSPPIRPFDPGRIPSDSGKESRGGGREERIRTNVLEVSGHVEAGPPRFRHVMQDRDASFQQAKVVVDRSKKRSLEEIFGITWATCDGSGSKGKSRHV